MASKVGDSASVEGRGFGPDMRGPRPGPSPQPSYAAAVTAQPEVLPGVREANLLSARWSARLASESSWAIAGVGVWSLLSFLAPTAAEPGRAELTTALGMAPGPALEASMTLLGTLRLSPTVHIATGLWIHDDIDVERSWLDRLPIGTVGQLSADQARDQRAVDDWVAEKTNGILRSMPLRADRLRRLVLAGAVSIETAWKTPFDNHPLQVEDGPWRGRTICALVSRPGAQAPDSVLLATTPMGRMTVVRVDGSDDIDVHLVIGEADRDAGGIVATAVEVLSGEYRAEAAANHPVGTTGPGLTIGQTYTFSGEPTLHVRAVRFSLEARHDLLEHADLFGLRTVSDASSGWFPGISSFPLAVGQAGQALAASFTAEGFRAAAVTYLGMRAGAAPGQPARAVSVSIDRPFGFVVVHRPTGLVLMCGWVVEPDDFPEEPSAGSISEREYFVRARERALRLQPRSDREPPGP